jgi:transcriptional regulator with XRE-family HTH domain
MIGEEVRRRREELGLTGAQLAERSGLAPSAVSQIETGKRTPSSSSVMKLAAGLGCEVGDLYPKDLSPRLPLEKHGGISEPRARLAAEPHLTIRSTWEAVEEKLSSDQLIEILEGVRNGRITVDTAASRLKRLVKEPA